MNPTELLKKYAYKLGQSDKVFDSILAHCEKVTEIALRIVDSSKVEIDRELVYQGAMLHDIGRFSYPPDKNSVFHGVAGGKILREEGLPELAEFCENHLGGGITKEEAVRIGLPPKDYMPRTLEQKIVCYADKLVNGRDEISYEAAIARFQKEMGDVVVKRIKRLHNEISALMNP